MPGESSSFLTPQFFDALVIGVVIAGLILAATRIAHDFRRGPRWPEDASNQQPSNQQAHQQAVQQADDQQENP